jgi:HK97 family phage portal protein
MGLLERVRTAVGITETAAVPSAVTEAAGVALAPLTQAQVRRTGYEYGIPLGTQSTTMQVARTSERQQTMNQLYQAYLSCPWVANPIDVIARTVTAGGLQIVSDEDVPEGEQPPEPPEVVELRRLVRFTNPSEDMIQLLRNVVTDLLLFGDAYLEVVTLLGHPVALYTLDATTMTVIADQHGEVLGYSQDVDGVRTAKFAPGQVIHISLDAPRGGVYGVSPAQKALLPVTSWLFWAATLKETGRRGDPPRLHIDLKQYQDKEVQNFREMYRVFNLGPRAVGEPIITTGDGIATVLDSRKVTDYLDALRQLRDEIISTFGVPPSKLDIIETGNLGGGTGEAQDKTFRVNTIIPIANLVLEKMNFHLVQQGFNIHGWHLEFKEIDFRDSSIVENIRKDRFLNGAYTINRWRDEIGEPPIDGGDVAIIETRRGIVAWDDMEAMSKASVGFNAAPLIAAGVNGYVPGIPDAEKPEPPVIAPLAKGAIAPPSAGKPTANKPPGAVPGGANDAAQGKAPKEDAFPDDNRRLAEAWQHARNAEYRARRKQALKELPSGRGDSWAN